MLFPLEEVGGRVWMQLARWGVSVCLLCEGRLLKGQEGLEKIGGGCEAERGGVPGWAGRAERSVGVGEGRDGEAASGLLCKVLGLQSQHVHSRSSPGFLC